MDYLAINSWMYQLNHPWHWLSYGQNADALQAVAAIFGIVGLICYVSETSRIRKATLAQSEATRRPFFRTSDKTLYSRDLNEVFQAMNDGEGHALSITCNFIDNPLSQPVDLGACCKGTTIVVVLVENEQTLRNIRELGLRLEYEDTGRKRYWTEIRLGPDNQEKIATGEVGRKSDGDTISRF
jgi:hypothetical protein